YANGTGIARNDQMAVQWFTKAAEQGHAVAQLNLGGMYRYGRGVARSYGEAHKWVRGAITRTTGALQKECVEARDNLALIMSDNDQAASAHRAKEWMDKLARRPGQGSPRL